MRLRLLYFWDVLKASFWFLPLLLLLLGILLSTGLYYLDTQVGLEGFPTLVQNLIGGGTESARSVLSTYFWCYVRNGEYRFFDYAGRLDPRLLPIWVPPFA
jgi:hypothetical protein